MRKRIQKWSNVMGSVALSLDGLELSREAWNALEPFRTEDRDECLEVEFTSSGYYDPGVTSGPVDRCYPPEGDDEREIESMQLEGEELPSEVVDILQEEEAIFQAVFDAEVNHDEW
jgi:hypothetical protein